VVVTGTHTSVCDLGGEGLAEPKQSLTLTGRTVRTNPAAEQTAADIRRSSRADRGMKMPVCLSES